MIERGRAVFRHFAAALRQALGIASPDGRDLDTEQARVRCVIGAGLLAYTLYLFAAGALTPAMRLVMIAACVPMLAGAWLILWFRRHSERPAHMRYFAICADLVPLTLGLWQADEPGVPLIGIYLWVTVGNGFRFGTKYLLFSYWLSVVCFVLLMLLVPFWQQHRGLGIGFMLILTTIPLYVLVLLSRLRAQKDAAVELSNAKSLFVANVSHELRTPLTGVYAVYDLLLRRHLPPFERELVGSLGNAITTLKGSVDAVLQMSKLEAGAEKAELRLFNLRHFLHQFSTLVRPQAAAKGLAWSLDIEPLVPSLMVGDTGHMQHVIGNLVNNALKFTPKGSVTLRVFTLGNSVRFEVIDTGIGIALEHQEALFERFVQADTSPTRRFAGTGLGTSIASDLVKLMGGTIGVESAPGHGSTFWFELPVGNAETAAAGTWDDRRDVLVVGAASPERDAVVRMLERLELKGVARVPDLTHPPSFAADRYLSALLVMAPHDAAAYADVVLFERVGLVCPWIVVSETFTVAQAVALLKSGAAALLPASAPQEQWRRELGALVNRIALGGQSEVPQVSVQRKLTVLLADDNASNRILLARILCDAGHDVLLASRGDEAFDLMTAKKPDLAMLDLNMPEMSGPDATKLWRAGEIGTDERLPIIILSADATVAARDLSLEAGANDHLTKPVTANAMLASIERVMAGVRPRAAARKMEDEAAPNRPAPFVPMVVQRDEMQAPPPPSVDLTAAPLVDTERIEALRRIANNDRTFLAQYVDAAFADLKSAIGELRRTLQKGDERGARDALHKIDGTAASIGSVALLAGAKNMRNYVTSGYDTDAQDALAQLASTCALTKSAVAALLHPQAAPNRPR